MTTMKAGDSFRLKTGGGGGFGSPLERTVDEVGADVVAGYISQVKAEKVYGVIVGKDGIPDLPATQSCRDQLVKATEVK